MPRTKTSQDRAAQALAKVDERIAALEARKTAAIAKIEERYAGDLDALRTERDHAAAHPALTQRPTPADAEVG